MLILLVLISLKATTGDQTVRLATHHRYVRQVVLTAHDPLVDDGVLMTRRDQLVALVAQKAIQMVDARFVQCDLVPSQLDDVVVRVYG